MAQNLVILTDCGNFFLKHFGFPGFFFCGVEGQGRKFGYFSVVVPSTVEPRQGKRANRSPLPSLPFPVLFQPVFYLFPPVRNLVSDCRMQRQTAYSSLSYKLQITVADQREGRGGPGGPGPPPQFQTKLRSVENWHQSPLYNLQFFFNFQTKEIASKISFKITNLIP